MVYAYEFFYRFSTELIKIYDNDLHMVLLLGLSAFSCLIEGVALVSRMIE